MLITVIVTTYNSHKKLKKVIESLTIQSDSEFEIIIADDGSSEKHFDNTKKLSKSLKKSYITQKSNMFGMKTKALELQKLEIRLLKKVMEIT
jgi:GT2 family glycosyltransferase